MVTGGGEPPSNFPQQAVIKKKQLLALLRNVFSWLVLVSVPPDRPGVNTSTRMRTTFTTDSPKTMMFRGKSGSVC